MGNSQIATPAINAIAAVPKINKQSKFVFFSHPKFMGKERGDFLSDWYVAVGEFMGQSAGLVHPASLVGILVGVYSCVTSFLQI